MKPILEVNELTKQLGSFKLDNVSFSLTEGCITGFIGVNGAGKTTTIKLLLGLIQKDAGEIKFFGKSIQNNEHEFKNRIGIVLDDGYFYDDLTLLEMKNVIAASYSNWDNRLFKRNIDRFGLPLNQRIGTLSKGMRMKYAIALAISHHADLLIMDEPTSGLDPQVRLELMDILLEYVGEGKSVFLSSHITSDLDKVADMLILIHGGRIIFSEEKDLLLDKHGLVKGDNKELNEQSKALFLTLDETDYGFSGLTADKAAVRRQMKNVYIERPSIEDIMLSYIKR
ncbi:ABC transporter ATP-binding protein [Paenibacillus montaniterrae]|uniref:ABC transporter ATP-binding protein n=1 Tax=Paenibacillus montaniterrae TaxID=429341 RepID=A0A920CTP8_9BACL|nr:ABC transporter ATP-binding protein [Paenibacillus montaniterrae]GIP16147.1 ABC transporter ATP-binding protein [Paenibacillus montaniterrae]